MPPSVPLSKYSAWCWLFVAALVLLGVYLAGARGGLHSNSNAPGGTSAGQVPLAAKWMGIVLGTRIGARAIH